MNFWAKKQETNSIFKWLPLTQHLNDTMEVAGLLWHQWLSRGQRDLVIASLDDDNQSEEIAYELTRFLGAVHDIGKATPVFQTIVGYNNSADLDFELLSKIEQEGFTDIKAFKSQSRSKSPHAIAGQALLADYGVGEDIASIIGGHHGKPVDNSRQISDQLKSYASNYFQVEDSENPIYLRWRIAQKKILNWSLKETMFNNVENLPIISQPAQVVLEGLLIMADWIASNENYFPLFTLDQETSPDENKRLEVGWSKWRKTHNWYAKDIYDIDDAYQERFGFKPKNLQSVFFKAIEETSNPGIIILEAPMGGGKTEAALIGAEQLAAKTGKSGIFFGLPTQATSDGIFNRIKSWVDKIIYQEGENKSIQLVHGKSALNENFRSIARNIDIDGDNYSGVIVNEWFSGRKTAMLDDFVVGTIDHFLMTALKQKHLALRHLGFSKKVVIIDEVHAYDAYMGQYLYKALRWLGAYNVPVIILSATLPMTTRVKLIENYIRGTGQKWRKVQNQSISGWENNISYPLITYNDGSAIKQLSDIESGDYKRVMVVRLEESRLLETIKESLSEGGIVGIIVNTVKRAQFLAQMCAKEFGSKNVDLLHSNYISTKRVEKEKDLLKIIGKGARRPLKNIIIGTQVIEQSLDIDFDVLISDLAPMDLLLQRVGRLHRHPLEYRPPKHQEPILYVLGMNDNFEFEGGSSAVYGDYLLMRTQLFLPEVIELPNDISTLVQQVYEKEKIILQSSMLQKYKDAEKVNEQIINQKETKAKHYQIENPKHSANASLISWLKNIVPASSEEQGNAQVRDSDETIEVIALKKFGDGYTIFGEKTDYAKLISDGKYSKEVAKETLRLPRSLSATYMIDKTIKELEKYNMINLSKWQELPWLKGLLGIIFDENNKFYINDYILTYDEKLGLLYEKEGENE